MDNVLVDFPTAFPQIKNEILEKYADDKDEIPGIFSLMLPIEGAVDAFNQLSQKYDTYILSTAPWENPSAWSDKLVWVKTYLGQQAHKRLILSHNKNLNKGDYLIDDRLANGAKDFQGEHIHFKTDKFPNWQAVLNYLL
jgi:5'(3')-deoxyribonucleotidase